MAQMVFKRYEIKYQLTEAQRERLERVMVEHMKPDEHGPSTVRNIYYDTTSHLLARRSAEHPNYKEKLRVRSYAPAKGDSDVFLELKKKYDGVVYKRRCTLPYDDAHALLMGARAPETQIEREIAYSAGRYEGLTPMMFVAYDREAFYAYDDHEFRMTFDRAIRCRWNDLSLDGPTNGRLLTARDQSLLEVKCAQGMPLWLVDFLSAEHIYKGRFSKYGAAVMCQMETNRRLIGVRRHMPARRPVGNTEGIKLGRRIAAVGNASLI